MNFLEAIELENRILLITKKQSEAIRVRNLLRAEEYGYKLFIEFNAQAGLRKIEIYRPDIILLRGSLFFVDVDSYLDQINENSLSTEIILLEDENKLEPQISREPTEVLSWEALTEEKLNSTIARLLTKKKHVKKTNDEPIDAHTSLIDQMKQQVSRTKANRVFLSLVQFEKDDISSYTISILHNQLHLSIKEDIEIFQRDASSVFILIGIRDMRIKLEPVVKQFAQEIQRVASSAFSGSTALMAAPVVGAGQIGYAYEGLLDLESYRYFCNEVVCLTNDHIEIYRRPVEWKAVSSALRALLAAVFDYNEEYIREVLHDLYIKMIKPSMSNVDLNFFRELVSRYYRTATVLMQFTPDDMAQKKTYWALEQECNETIQCFLHLCNQGKRSTQAKANIPVIRAISYIADNYESPISLVDIADAIGISKSYLCRIFKEQIGSNVIDYLLTVRIQAAKANILSGEDNIQELARRCGFTDPKYFSRVFKRLEGIPPSEYTFRLKLEKAKSTLKRDK